MSLRNDDVGLRDSNPPSRYLPELPSSSDGFPSVNSKTNSTEADLIFEDPPPSSNQLRLIYISMAACLTAMSVALIVTIFFGARQVTPRGFLISEFGPCSEAGKQIMTHRGGNAVDALVSMVLCLAVTRPDIISLGGCGVFWVHKRDTNVNELFDAMCTSPNVTSLNKSSAADNVSVPGFVAGVKALHDAHGSLRWSEIFNPAIEMAKMGFLVHPDLLKNLEKVANSSFARSFIKSIDNGTHGPQLQLEATLRRLAAEGSLPFYGGIIGQSIISELLRHNITWRLDDDLGSYQVQKRNQIELGLAGFKVYGFPSPLVGGILTTTTLANLDLLNHERPLNARKLTLGESSELALIYHRLIELTKLGTSQISFLGDPNDPITGEKVTNREKDILSFESRKLIAGKVLDNHVMDAAEVGKVDPIFFATQDATTFALSVESDMLIAAASLTLGGAFGSGLVVPETGILLNSAQSLFSSLGKESANSRSPGRRPLLPVSPIFFETAQHQCGHRFVAASSGGIQGMIGLSQVLISSFLYLSNVTCGQLVEGLPSAEVTTATYSPSVGTCLPLNDSLDLKRFKLLLRQTEESKDEFVVRLQPGFNPAVSEELKKIGHIVETSTEHDDDTNAGAVGWTLYTTVGGVEKSAVNSSAFF